MSVEYTVTTSGSSRTIVVQRDGDGLTVMLDDQTFSVSLAPRHLGPTTHYTLRVGTQVTPVVIRPAGGERLVGVGMEQYRLRVERRLPIPRRGGPQAAGPREIVAPMPGLVIAVEVGPGAAVERGTVLIILEAMKMQSEIRAPVPGRVAAVRVRQGQEVAGGAVLAVLEPTG